MGRMLEALKNKETTRLGSRDKPFFEDTFEHGPAAAAEGTAAAEDGIPFIEVGPNKKVEGSAQVMAVKHSGQPRVEPPHQPVSAAAAPAAELRSAGRAPQTNNVRATLESPRRGYETGKALAATLEPWSKLTLPEMAQGIATEIITYHHPEHPISKQYASLVAKMQEGQKTGTSQVVLLTGGRPQVGTSTVLLNLAVAAVQHGSGRVVVLDANMRRPGLAQRLGYVCAAGLQDVLAGRLALEQAVVQTSVHGLYLLPAQTIAADRPLKAEATAWLLGWLGEHFNLVLVDGPPVDAGNDLPVLAAACDAAYLVLPEGEGPQTQRSLTHALSAMGAHMSGLFHTANEAR